MNKSFWLAILRILKDFSEHSSIHGVKYLGENGRSCFEKIWWIVSILSSVLCCGKLIFDIWHTDPIIINFQSSPTPIWQIPFPAVSICPNVLTHYKHMNLTESVLLQCNNNPADARRTKLLNAVSMMCPADVIYKNFESYTNCNDCLETLREIRIPPRDLFVECKFQNRTIDCLESFEETVARIAICYTFNGFDPYRKNGSKHGAISKEWSVDGGYKSLGTLDTYPRRASGGGTQQGITILLRLSKHDFEYKCNSKPGFSLQYRMPYDIPESKQIDISMGYSYNIILTPQILTTAKELHHYPVSERKCFLSDEHRLKYFNQYTQSNCEQECEIDKILEACGCLPINIENRGHSNICGFEKFYCSESIAGILIDENFFSCNCLPACTTMTYDSELFVTPLNMSGSSKYRKHYQKDFAYSQITIYFKEDHFLASERREIYGPTVFLANCGGLLGLFLGASVISILEIFYYCTIRICCSSKNRADINKIEITIFEDKRYLKILRKLLADYSNKTTIQGINYATNTNLSLLERFWWTFVVTMSILCCGLLISDVVRHYDQSPIIVSYANEETQIYEIPFPAVTICPHVVGKLVWKERKKFQNVSLYSESLSSQDFVNALAQICDPELFWDIDPENRTSCERCASLFRHMTLGINDMMTQCTYQNTPKSCRKIFKTVTTESGICFTFNGFDVYRHQDEIESKETYNWTLDSGYRNGAENKGIFPRPGSRSGLLINIETTKDAFAGLCKGPLRGYRIYVHLPNEIPPMTDHHSYLAPYQTFAQFLIDPDVITAKPEIRDFPFSKRQCYFSDERQLRFFKFYTQNNCEAECLANLTLVQCNCLRFHIPKVPGVKICGIGDIKCYHHVIEQNAKENIDQSQASGCNCFPTCNSISYHMETSQNVVTKEELKHEIEFIKALARYKCMDLPDEDNSQDDYIDYSKEHKFVALQRSQLYGPIELLSHIGGLMGLFLGFSLTSVLELAYFCTIRLFCSFKF